MKICLLILFFFLQVTCRAFDFAGPPNAPTALTFNSITTGSMNGSFTASGSTTGYLVLRRTGSTPPEIPNDGTVYSGTFGTSTVVSNNSATSFSSTGLIAGTLYYYAIFSYNGGTNYHNSSSLNGSQVTVSLAPVTTTPPSILQTSFIASWVASTGATAYFLDVSNSNTFSTFITGYNNLNVGNVTAFSVNTNLTAGTTYYYRVRASNAGGTSLNSSTISLITLSPVATVATIAAAPSGQTTFMANWLAVTSATGYRLDVATNNGFTSFVSGYQDLAVSNVLTKNVTGLSGGVVYYYRIRAVSTAGTSGSSNIITASTIPSNPTLLIDGSTQNSFSIRFLSTGSTDYRLDVSTDNFVSFVTGYNDLSTGSAGPLTFTLFTINNNLSSGTVYNFRVRAVNGSGPSGNVTLSVTTYPSNPVATAATSATQTSFIAHWNPVVTATDYLLDVSNDGFLSFFGIYGSKLTGNVTSVTVNGLAPGVTYQFRVRAVGTGVSYVSNIIYVITVPSNPLAVLAIMPSESSFTAKWMSTPGADSYQVEVSNNPGFSSYLPGFSNLAVASTSVEVYGLTSNTTYYYRVRALNSAGVSGNSNTISQLTLSTAPVAIAATVLIPSGFTANWLPVVGAIYYKLDVATDIDFSLILPSYGDLTIAGNTMSVTGLLPGALFYYQVRAVNATGPSLNSNIISQVTIPSTPTAVEPTLITTSSFNANWLPSSGASGYRVDVSTDNFVTFVAGFNYLVTSATTASVTGLGTGITYYYRVRSFNSAGVSANSNFVSVVTVPLAPTAQPATTITPSSFIANWTIVPGATVYLLDVSADNFLSFLTGYNARAISSLSLNSSVTGFQDGTVYSYRVRASNASGESVNSNTVSLITIPAAPITNPVVTKGSNNFIATWEPVQGAISYELDVSLFTSNFTTFISGYNAKSITGITEALVSGLASGASYKFRVRAVNGGGTSGNSASKSVITDGGNVQPLNIVVSSFNGNQFIGSSITVDGQVFNALGAVSAILVYKGITGTVNKEKPINVSGTVYSIVIDDSMLDELGVEFFIKAEDETDIFQVSETRTLYRTFSAVTSPMVIESNFEGNRSSIRIISVPLDPKDNLIQSIFFPLGVYDKKGWRLAHYMDGRNVEFGAGINSIARGLGYWFNARGSVLINAGEGNVGKYDQKNPFQLSLVKGWNQIGNPFPFDIDWSDVLTDNPGIAGVGGLTVYSGIKQNFETNDKLKKNNGGFVFSEQPVVLNVAVTLKNSASRKGKVSENPDIGQPSWQVPFSITQNNSTNDLGAIGMNPGALISKDQWDEIRLPRLDEFLDVTFHHPEYEFSHFSKDIIPTSNEHVWKLSIESSGAGEQALLEWNNETFGNNSAQLILLDVEAARFIDMRGNKSYSFTNSGEKEFRIYYRNDDEQIVPDLLLVGRPYPNPSSESIRVMVILPETSDPLYVELTALNLFGQLIKPLLRASLMGGIYEVKWDGNDASGSRVPPGVYVLQTKVNGRSISPTHKIIMK